MDLLRMRGVLAAHLGQPLTPELAAQVEQAACFEEDRTIDPLQFPARRWGRYVFAVERFDPGSLHELHALHYAETEVFRASIPMRPDYGAMALAARRGQLIQFTVRLAETHELVGNARLYVVRSMHTRTLMAREDTFFVVAEHRGGFMAIRLWQFVERCLAELGVREIHLDTKKVNKVDRMAVYLGYQEVATKFVKILEAPDVQ